MLLQQLPCNLQAPLLPPLLLLVLLLVLLLGVSHICSVAVLALVPAATNARPGPSSMHVTCCLPLPPARQPVPGIASCELRCCGRGREAPLSLLLILQQQ